MNARRGISTWQLRLLYILFAMAYSIANVSVFAQGGTEPIVPTITKHPTSLSTNSKNATLMLYTQALPNDDGALAYQWYSVSETTLGTTPNLSDAAGKALVYSKGEKVIGATSYTLNTTTENADTYYYWCRVSNTKGGNDDNNLYKINTNICKVVVVDRELYDELINGKVENWTCIDLRNNNGNVSNRATTWYVMDAGYEKTNGWYTTHTDKWVDARERSIAARNRARGIGSIEAVKYTEYKGGNPNIAMTAKIYDGVTKTLITNDPDSLGKLSCELSADVPSSNYQDIATKSGKIYEWSLDVGARNGNGEAVALIIGPAINTKDDYGDFKDAVLYGRSDDYETDGQNVPSDTLKYPDVSTNGTNHVIYRWVDRSAQLTGTIDGWTGRPTTNNLILDSDKVYRYGMDLALNGHTSTTTEKETIGTTSNVRVPTYFNDILKKTADTHITPFAIRNRYELKGQSGKSFVTTYNNRTYYVSIATAHEVHNWYRYSGVYSVPVGQGTTVFAFAFIPMWGNTGGMSGNLFDNVVFQPGTPPTMKTYMAYSGHVSVEVNTRPDYVYGIAEVRGSAVDTYSEEVYIKGSTSPLTATNLGEGTSNWYQVSGNQTIEFKNLTPGKTYRIVGIPRGAVSNELGTNVTPAKVLDDGYYIDETIKPTYPGQNDEYMATVGARDNLIFLTNSNSEVAYALLDADDPSIVVREWTPGIGLGSQQVLFFKDLERNHCYYVVARPLEWTELTYELAAGENFENAVRVCTPPEDMNDIREEQVTRERYTEDGKSYDRIIIKDAAAIADAENMHKIDDANTYSLYDGEEGNITTPTNAIKTIDGVTCVVFDGLDINRIYHIAVKPAGDEVYLTGVRVYQYPDPSYIHYVEEKIGYGETKLEFPTINEDKNLGLDTRIEEVRYRMYADNQDKTWLLGDGDTYITVSNAYVWLGVNKPSTLDRMQQLQSEAVFVTSLSDLWPQADFPSVFPVKELIVPLRPEPPVADKCDGSVTDPNYKLDYINEKLIVLKGELAYSLDNGTNYETIDGTPKEVSFAKLGWVDDEMDILLRIPAKNTTSEGGEGYFASKPTTQTVLGRGAAPVGPYATLNKDGNGNPVNMSLYSLVSTSSYQYKLQTQSWSDATNVTGETGVTGLKYETDTNGARIDYEIRYAATCDKPASLSQQLSLPLTIIPINFGSAVYGYTVSNDPSTASNVMIRNVDVRNVGNVLVTFTKMEILNAQKDGVEYTGNLFSLTVAGNRNVPGTSEDGTMGQNNESTIQPVTGLGVGAYTATLKITFPDPDTGGKEDRITSIVVAFNVLKAPQTNNLEIKNTSWTDASLTIGITGVPNKEAVIEYQVDGGSWIKAPAGTNVTGELCKGLDEATPYLIAYRLAETDNYLASETNYATYYTAYSPEAAAYINYKSETLILIDDSKKPDYEVTVNGHDVSLAYKFSEEELLGAAIAVEIVKIGDKGIGKDPNIPQSAPYEMKNIKGREPAPTGVKKVNSSGKSEDDENTSGPYNIIKLGNETFEYCLAGTIGWQQVTGQTEPLSWGAYQVRYPAVNTANGVLGHFASKYTTVYILPELEPKDKELFVNINAAVGADGYTGKGDSWKNATFSLSSAITYARTNHGAVNTIHVATGTYKPIFTPTDRDATDKRNNTFSLSVGTEVIGGYNIRAIDGTVLPPSNEATILLGEVENEEENGGVYHVVSLLDIEGNKDKTTQATLSNVVVTGGKAVVDGDNATRNRGAGVHVCGGKNLKLINVMIHSNEAKEWGGGLFVDTGSTATLTNVTVAGNKAATGSGIYSGGTLKINNTLVYGNKQLDGEQGVAEIHHPGNATTFSPYSSLAGNMNLNTYTGRNNIDDANTGDGNKVFVSMSAKNFNLKVGSVAQDVGNNNLYNEAAIQAYLYSEDNKDGVKGALNYDVFGRPRISGSAIDLGASEMQTISVSPKNSPISGGSLLRLQAFDIKGLPLNNLYIEINGVEAKIEFQTNETNPKVGTDGVLYCRTGVSPDARKCGVVVYYKEDDNTLREIDSTAPRSFTYFPVVFIEDGKWTDYFKWEGQTDDLILPGNDYPNPITHIHIMANCEQNVSLDQAEFDQITVYPRVAYTLEGGNTTNADGDVVKNSLTANTMTLKDNASFINNGGTVDVEKQDVEHVITKGRNWYISNPLDMTDDKKPGRLEITNPVGTKAPVVPGRIERFDELNKNWQRISVPSGITDDMETGVGYTIYSALHDMNIKFTGKYNDGDVERDEWLTRTGDTKSGFNLVGNPFPSYWQWTEKAAADANLYSTIWYRTNVNGVYEFWSYNATGNVGVAPSWENDTPTGSYSLRHVPPLQAFWVRVKNGSTTGTLTFANANRTHADHGSNVLTKAQKEDAESRPMLRLCASNEQHIDELLIYADPMAKAEFDDYDSEKWFEESGVEIYSMPQTKSHQLVINSLPALKNNTEVPLGFQTTEGGSFSIYAKELLNMDDVDVYLVDKLREVEFDLRSGAYQFSASSVPTADRFSIVFRGADGEHRNDGLYAKADNDGNVEVALYLQDETGEKATVKVYDTAGRKVTEQQIVIGEPALLKRSLARGVYMINAKKYTVKLVVAAER